MKTFFFQITKVFPNSMFYVIALVTINHPSSPAMMILKLKISVSINQTDYGMESVLIVSYP